MPAPPLTLAAIRQPAFLWVSDGRVAAANDLAEALAGRPLAGCAPPDILATFGNRRPDGTPFAPDELPPSRALRGEEVIDLPMTVTAADGRAVRLLVTASPLRDGDAVTGALVVWQDVSALEAARAGQARLRSEAEGRETELRLQRHLLDRILGALPCRVSLWGRDERLAWANERFAAERGASREALLGRSWRDLGAPPEVVEPLVREALQAARAGATVVREVEVAGTDGREWRACTFLPFGVDSLLVITEEISERRATDEALRGSLERLGLAQKAARAGFWDRDMTTGAITWSPEFYDLFGLDPGTEASFESWLAAIHPDDREEVMAAIDRSIEERVPLENQYRVVLSGGRVRWISTLGNTTRGPDGRPLRMTGISVDVTDRETAERALAASEARFRALFETMNEGFMVVEPVFDDHGAPVSFRHIEVNPAKARLSGLSREELVGRDALETAPGVEGCFVETYARVAQTGEPARLEAYAAGLGRWLSVDAYSPEPGRAAVVVSDITARKEAEERQAFLLALGDRLRELDDATRIATESAEMVGRHLGANGVVYCEIDEKGECAAVRADWTDGTVPPAAGRFRMDDFGIGELYRRGEARRVTDVAAEHGPDEAAEHSALEVRASLGVPILHGGRLSAVLAVHGNRPRAWTDAEVELVREAGDRVWSAVERARAAEALRRRAEELGAVMDLAPAAIWVGHDPGCTLITGNRLANELYEAEPDENVSAGRLPPEPPSPRLFYAPDGRELAAEELPMQVAAAANTPVRNAEFAVLLPSGRRRHLLGSAVPLREPDGSVRGAVAAFLDVTERQGVERALAESEERLRLAQEGAAIGVWDWDVRTGRQTYTAELPRLYGVEGEALESVDLWRRHIHPDDRERVETERNTALAAGAPFEVEFRVVRPSGEVRWLAGTGRGVYDDQGTLVRVIGTNMDITRRKEAEAGLARTADEIRRSNEELQRFAYVASHDLQEPLRSIVSFSQLLERRYRGRLDADADDYIAFIVEGGNRMQALIADLLQLSRVETAAKPPRPTDTGAVLYGALRTLEASLRETGAHVRVEPLPEVTADWTQLEQVFANLVGNALKYRKPGVPPAIAISAERKGEMWEFAVADNGIGIEAEYFDRIFEMFRRLHTHDEYEGTGIGLAVVKRIVERHGGTVRVESTPGEGSTFFFTLPAV